MLLRQATTKTASADLSKAITASKSLKPQVRFQWAKKKRAAGKEGRDTGGKKLRTSSQSLWEIVSCNGGVAVKSIRADESGCAGTLSWTQPQLISSVALGDALAGSAKELDELKRHCLTSKTPRGQRQLDVANLPPTLEVLKSVLALFKQDSMCEHSDTAIHDIETCHLLRREVSGRDRAREVALCELALAT